MDIVNNAGKTPKRGQVLPKLTGIFAAMALAGIATPSHAAYTQMDTASTQVGTVAAATCAGQLDDAVLGLEGSALVLDFAAHTLDAIGLGAEVGGALDPLGISEAVAVGIQVAAKVTEIVAYADHVAAFALETDASRNKPSCSTEFYGSVEVSAGGTSVTGDSIFNNNLDVTGALGVSGGATITGGATINGGTTMDGGATINGGAAITSNTGNSLVVDDVSARIQSADNTDFVAVSAANGVNMNGNGATATLNGTSASLLNSTGHGLTITDTMTVLSGGANSSKLYLMDNRAYLGVGTATEAEVILIDAVNSGGGITSVTIGTATAGHTNNLVGGVNNIGTTVTDSVNTIGNAGTSANTLTGATNAITGTTSNTISTGANTVVTDTASARLANGTTTVSVNGTNSVVAAGTNNVTVNGTTGTTVTGNANVNGSFGVDSNGAATNGNTLALDASGFSVDYDQGVAGNTLSVTTFGLAANGNGGTLSIDGNNVSLLNNVADSSLGLSGHGLNITSSQTTLTGGTLSSVLTLADGDAGGTTLSVGGSVSGSATLFSATTNDVTTISTVTIGTATTAHTNNIVGAVNNIGTTVSGSVNTIGNAGTSVNTLTGTSNDLTALSTNTLTAGTNNVLNAAQQNQLTGGTGNVITAITGSNTITAAGGDNQIVTSAAGAATGTAIQGTGTTDGVSLAGTSGGQTAMMTLGQDNRYGAGTPVANFSTTGGAPIRVTGVANGVYDYDAVNMSQYNYLAGVVRDTQKFAYSGTASVAAMAGIPDPAPGKRYNFGLGVGQYEGYRAVAAGFKGHVTDNLSVTAGAAFSSYANTYNAGMGYSW